MYLNRRKSKGKEDKNRFTERMGYAGVERPEGDVVWFHGASVGEAVSMLSLIDKIQNEFPNKTILVTTGTVSSAEIMLKKLPKNVIHQYVPVDLLPAVRRFLDYWKPKVALFFEAEFWPNLIMEAQKRDVKLLLINGRVSDVAFKKWEPHQDLACQMLEHFDLALGQTSEDERRIKILGAPHTMYLGNLKFAGSPMKCNEDELAKMREKIGNRPTWVVASTHETEEEEVAKIHQEIAKKYPNLLTIIAPRNAKRGEEIKNILKLSGLKSAMRSKEEEITSHTQVYIADTMGELGLFFRLTKIVLMGFSLTEKSNGGHNALEPAILKTAVVNGPYYENFKEMFDRMSVTGALTIVRDLKDMGSVITELLDNPEKCEDLAEKAYNFATGETGVLDRVMDAIKGYL